MEKLKWDLYLVENQYKNQFPILEEYVKDNLLRSFFMILHKRSYDLLEYCFPLPLYKGFIRKIKLHHPYPAINRSKASMKSINTQYYIKIKHIELYYLNIRNSIGQHYRTISIPSLQQPTPPQE